MKQFDSTFDPTAQQDAHEFSLSIIPKFQSIVDAIKLSNPVLHANWSPISDLLEIRILKVTKCSQCKTKSNTLDSALDIQVQLDETSRVTRDFDWGITKTMAKETLEGEEAFQCTPCGSLQEAKAKSSLSYLPRFVVLRVQNQRYMVDSSAAKLLNPVSATEELDFAKWMNKGYNINGPSVKYVIGWFKFDDATVSPISKQEMDQILSGSVNDAGASPFL
ncbi:hypothetical protein BGX26_007942 [Mortierella sp. AD094]|nr:hypothetical protein BGX26_007942 [Mortierella sp. AD094]